MTSTTPKVCCVCNINQKGKFHKLTKKVGDLNIGDKLDYCIPEIVQLKSSYSTLICKNCLKSLNSIYDFKLLCLKTHQNLFDQYKKNEEREHQIFEPEIETEIKSEPLQLDNPEDDEMITVYHVEVIKEVEENDENNYENNLSQDLSQIAESLASFSSSERENDEAIEYSDEETLTGYSYQDVKISNVELQKITDTMSVVVPEERNSHLICKFCGMKFRTAKTCKDHENEHGDKKPNICLVCMKILGPHIQLRDHLQEHFSSSKERTCELCNETFLTPSQLHYHRTVNHDKATLVCTFCKRHFVSKLALTTHINTHMRSEDDLVPCKVCGKKYISQMNCDRHYQLVHEKIKPFSCHLCNRSFGLKHYLKKHLDVHTGVKRYQCTLCSKTFRYQESLTHHLKVHKKYKCPLCDDCFMTFKQMREHERQHRSDLPYHCNFCGMKFKLSSHLSNHISRKHNDDIKPFLK